MNGFPGQKCTLLIKIMVILSEHEWSSVIISDFQWQWVTTSDTEWPWVIMSDGVVALFAVVTSDHGWPWVMKKLGFFPITGYHSLSQLQKSFTLSPITHHHSSLSISIRYSLSKRAYPVGNSFQRQIGCASKDWGRMTWRIGSKDLYDMMETQKPKHPAQLGVCGPSITYPKHLCIIATTHLQGMVHHLSAQSYHLELRTVTERIISERMRSWMLTIRQRPAVTIENSDEEW